MIQCDKCEREFDVPKNFAETKIPCPFCGDINRVPERTGHSTAAAKSPTQASGGAVRSAPVKSKPKDDAERTICTVRPAMFRAHPWKYTALVLLILGGITLVVLSLASVVAWPWLIWPGLLIGVVGLVWFGAWWMVVHYWTKLIVSNKRTTRHEGIIKRHTTEVLHDHVRSVDIQQTLMERILGVGTVGIDSAGQDSVEIVMKDIPKPYEIKKVIDTYRKM